MCLRPAQRWNFNEIAHQTWRSVPLKIKLIHFNSAEFQKIHSKTHNIHRGTKIIWKSELFWFYVRKILCTAKNYIILLGQTYIVSVVWLAFDHIHTIHPATNSRIKCVRYIIFQIKEIRQFAFNLEIVQWLGWIPLKRFSELHHSMPHNSAWKSNITWYLLIVILHFPHWCWLCAPIRWPFPFGFI
jgi:hypothetical protein